MKIYNFPKKYEKKSTDFIVRCDGEDIPVYSCDTSAVPLNQVWPGYQRPIEQTEKSSFLMLSSNENLTLDIIPKKNFDNITVRPLSKGIKPQIEEGLVRVAFPGIGQYTVEFGNIHQVLTVFINPEKEFTVDKSDNNIMYFGPGIHHINERIKLNDGQTVFIDEGAVLYGAIEAVDKKNIRIIGYGILDNSNMKRANEMNGCAVLAPDAGENTGNPIFLNRCENVLIEGITIVNSSGWSIYVDGCADVTVDNIKLIGMWRYNSDGCDVCNSKNVILKNSFLRNFDDCIVIKGFKLNNNLPLENVIAENCVLWCDWGRALEVGAETSAPYMKEIKFRNCDIISGCHIMMEIQHGDRAQISNVYFEDIRVEYRARTDSPQYQKSIDDTYLQKNDNYMPTLFAIVIGKNMWAIDDESGNLKNIYFKDIAVTTEDGRVPKNSRISVRDGKDRIDGVFFENITVNGEKCNMDTIIEKVDSGAKNISWKS